MVLGAAKTVTRILCIGTISCIFAHAGCSVEGVLVKRRAQQDFRNARVRVQLAYGNDHLGESGETTVEDGRFSIRIAYLTQSRKPVLMGNLREKCDRKPKKVVITLLDNTGEYDRLSLDFPADFKASDPSNYVLRSEVVLKGSR